MRARGAVRIALTATLWMPAVLMGCLTAPAAVAGPIPHAADGPPLVRVDGGYVGGHREGEVESFKGIPYAAPPVGELRWRAPQPVLPWAGERRAQTFGPDCMQVRDSAPRGVTSAEDCLYVNVWKPSERSAQKHPVMVWIYGGGFVNGGGSSADCDGSAFARDGIVLVSFNYRLGNFGFFAHPALTAENPQGPLGNYALMDQVAALKWVQRNISRFGGDPGNVTIFGESAGGLSVHVLLISPLAQGLFHKAIIESGAGRSDFLDVRTLAQAQERGLRLAQKFAIGGEGPEALLKLRAIPAQTLVGGLTMANRAKDPTYAGGAIVEPQLNLGNPTRLYRAGKGARVPVMIGANSADIASVPARTLDELYATFGPDAEAARSLYPAAGRDLPAVALQAGGDRMMVEPARRVAQILAARGQRVYEYRFDYVAQSLRLTSSGAPHGSEVPYVFNTVATQYGKDLAAPDAAAARAVHAYWVAFAKSGKPEPAGLPAWPAYDAGRDELMSFTADGPVAGPDRWKARLDLAQRVSERREQGVDGVR
jgi:para-nitrobenzyl esterase